MKYPPLWTATHSQARVKEAVASLKLVGGVFIVAGLLALWIAWSFSRFGFIAQLLSAATAVVLIGPGVWYFIAGIYLKRGQVWVVSISRQVALGQFAAMALTTLLRFLGNDRYMGMMFAPAVLAIFFVPALLVTLWKMGKAAKQVEAIQGHGFAVKVIPAADAVTESNPPSAPPPTS